MTPRTYHRWVADLPGPAPAPGVRLVDGRPSSEARLRAALDAIGPEALVAGRSALWVHGVVTAPRPLEVVAPHAVRWRGDRLGVHLRRSRTLLAEDAVEVDGWPVTSPERTALDLAAELSPEARVALVVDLAFSGRTAVSRLRDRVDRTPTAFGARALSRTLDELGTARPDSIFEWLVRRDLARAGLRADGPRNVPTPDGTYEVDLVVEGRRLAVECDGATHRSPEQLARDGRKANALGLDGWILLRTDWPSYRTDPGAFLGTVLRAASLARPA